jgi:hypothetical protein
MSREKELKRILQRILESPNSVRSPVFRAVIIHRELEREARRALARPERTIH